jgi:hypothetical protein
LAINQQRAYSSVCWLTPWPLPGNGNTLKQALW